ncbi:glycosyltransferase family 4 protein [Achromobacter sp. Marseille-Q0513]|uniref:glycosyltransferase family 4 protein n=1 Tax=Achromobacter sp. Marseille-Q0513 TaxID=2829161 RepID=UPI001B91775F|nr:glycosyltransferase family 4 protein [Achromobacter sp. Marseille-Q0513]MBR8657352.1 glycosyltransferase family 4 protein [Achromobacter sp. Marseille-Q0513]
MFMRILVVSQYFWPESFIINDMVRLLVEEGHEVEVLTGKPNYPDGNFFPGYASKGYQREIYDGNIVVHRVPLRPRKNGGTRNLILNYLSFVANGLFWSKKVLGKHDDPYDVIFAFALSPITSVIPAVYLKRRFKIPLVVWVQDLWPESLSATGFVTNKFALRAVGAMVRWIYSNCDRILVQSKRFFDPVSKFADPAKLEYYPNSYLEPDSEPEGGPGIPPAILRAMEQNFCVLFAGNIGTAQSVETIVGAARKLAHLQGCKIVMVGSGSMLAWVEQQKAEHGLDNLILAGRYPPSAMPQFFLRAQALLVTLKRDEIFAYTVPSKIQAYFCAGRPIIAALDGEGAQVVRDAQAGVVCSAEDVEGLCRSVEHMYRLSAVDLQEMAESGRRYFLEHFEMRSQTRELSRILAAVCDVSNVRQC